MPHSRDDPSRPRLVVLGLDGVPPEILFGGLRGKTPNFDRLVQGGARARLRTTDPPTSIPAWPVMFTGQDPGTLGVYGFRRRPPGVYHSTTVRTSAELPVPTLWEILSTRGYRLAVVGMPLGYPPPQVNGAYISDFLTPAGSRDWTYPAELAAEIEGKFGGYTFDVVFRSSERAELLNELVRMTRQRFAVAEWLYDREPWDVFALHEIGTDRLNHAYWKYFDRAHPKYEAGNPYEDADRTYWEVLDECVGRLLARLDDRTLVLVVSDHGAMSMRGCFCINEWLQQQGYLVLREEAKAPGAPLARLDVDWPSTTAWGEGGYFSRLYVNVRGREAEGVVPAERLPELKRQLTAELSQVRDPSGLPLGVEALDPERLYEHVTGDAPDLMLYFGDLKWRSAGTLGHGRLFIEENDIGPDDAVHSLDGVYLLFDPRRPEGREIPPLNVRDVTSRVLSLLGEPLPEHLVTRAPVAGTSSHPPVAPPATPRALAPR